MQGDPAIVARLNEVLTNELTSVNQYFLHARNYLQTAAGEIEE